MNYEKVLQLELKACILQGYTENVQSVNYLHHHWALHARAGEGRPGAAAAFVVATAAVSPA